MTVLALSTALGAVKVVATVPALGVGCGGSTSCLPTIHSVAENGGLSDVFVLRSAEFLGESDEKPFRPADVAETIRVFILDYFAYELRAALAELSSVSSMSSTANMTRR